MDNILKYGDFVQLFGKQTKKSALKKKKTSGSLGYLNGVGGLNPAVYFQEIKGSSKGIGENTGWKEVLEMEEDSVFQIHPKLESKMLKNFALAKKAILRSNERVRKKGLNIDIKAAEAAFLNEKVHNNEIIRKFSGKQLHYGEEIQLFHVRSKCYVSPVKGGGLGSSQISQSEMNSLRIEFTNRQKSENFFVIQPRYKIRAEGDLVRSNDQFILFNPKLNGFLEVQHSDVSNETIRKAFSFKELSFRRTQSKTKCLKTAALYSNPSNFGWEALQCQKRQHSDRVIYGNEFVYLQHSETQAYLTAYPYKTSYSNLMLRRYIGKEPLEVFTVQSIWQLQILQPSTRERFGPIETQATPLILRNYFTGLVIRIEDDEMLSSQRFTPNANEGEFLLKLESFSNKLFSSVVENESYSISTSNNFTFTSSSKFERGFLLGKTTRNHLKERENDQEDDENEGGEREVKRAFKKLSLEEEDIRAYFLDLNKRNKEKDEEHLSMEDAFKIERVPLEDMQAIMFIETGTPRLLEVNNLFKNQFDCSGDFRKREYEGTMGELSVLFKKMRAFIVGASFEDFDEREKYSLIQSRQKFFKDMMVIDMLADFVIVPFAKNAYSFNEISEYPAAQLAFCSAYDLIIDIINEYPPNMLYASQWLELFVYQSSVSKGKNMIGAQKMVTKLLENNQRLLGSMKENTVREIIEILRNGGKEDIYIDMVNALVMTENEPIERNQQTISRLLFQEGIYESALHLETGVTPDEQAAILVEGEGLIPIEEFNSLSGYKYRAIYNYFKAMVNLLANLCFKRNFSAIHPVRQCYSFDFCLKVVENKLAEFEIRQVFLRLLFVLYIDVDLEKVLYPHHLRIWNKRTKEFASKIKEESLTTRTVIFTSRIRVIKELVLSHLSSSTPNSEGTTKKTGINNYIVELLFVTRKLLYYGEFSTTGEFEGLKQILLPFLNDSPFAIEQRASWRRESLKNFIKVKGEHALSKEPFELKERKQPIARQDRSNNPQILRIKAETLKIFKKMYKIKTDHWVSEYLQHFKQSLERKTETPIFRKIKKGLPWLLNSQNEPIEWVSSILQKKSYVNFSDQSLPCILTDLMFFKDSRLRTSAFQLLVLIFMKTNHLHKNIKNVYIVEDEEVFRNLVKINSLTADLCRKAERCELWIRTAESAEWLEKLAKLHLILRQKVEEDSIPLDENEGPDVSISNRDSICPLKVEHRQLSSKLLNNRCLVSGLPISISVSQAYDQFNVLCDVEEYSHELIKLFLFKKGEKGLLNLLEFCSTIKYQSLSISKVQIATYNTLIVLAHKSSSLRKRIATHFWVMVLNQISTSININAHLLLREAFADSDIVQDCEVVKPILLKLIKATSEIMHKSQARAASVLSTAQVFLKSKGKTIKHNQTSFMITISQFPLLLLLVDNRIAIGPLGDSFAKEGKRFIQSLQDTENTHVHEYPTKRVYYQASQASSYFISLFTLLSLSCEGMNGTTESIGMNLYSEKELMELIGAAEELPFVRRAIWRFFYHCYFSSHRPKDKFAFMLQPLLKDFKLCCLMLSDTMEDQSNILNRLFIVTHEGVHLLREVYIHFLIEALVPLVCDWCLCGFSQTRHDKELVYANEFYQGLSTLSEKIKKGQLSFQGRDLFLKSLFQTKAFIVMNVPVLMSNLTNRSLQNKRGLARFVAKRSWSNVSAMIEAEETTKESKKAQSISQKFTESVKQLVKPKKKGLECIWSLATAEKLELVQYLASIKRNSKSFDRFNQIQREEVYLMLLGVLKDAKEAEIALDVVHLFRTIIEDEIKLTTSHGQQMEKCTIAEADVDEINKNIKSLRLIQNLLVRIGLLDYLLLSFTRWPQKFIKEQILLTMISLLKGGNTLTQSRFFSVVSKDKSNSFMVSMHTFQSRVFTEIKKTMKETLRQQTDEYLAKKSNKIKENFKKTTLGSAKIPKKKKSVFKNVEGYFKKTLFPSPHGEKGYIATNDKDDSFVFSEESEAKSERLKSEQGSNNLLILESERILMQENSEIGPSVSASSSRSFMDYESTKFQGKKGENSKMTSGDKTKRDSLVLLGRRILRFNQQICENHFQNNQNFLREQKLEGENEIHTNSKNFVELAMHSWLNFVRFVNSECIDFGIDLIDFLIESIQGPCPKNQALLSSKKVVESVMSLFYIFSKTKKKESNFRKRGFCSQESLKRVSFLQNHSVTLLVNVIEGPDDPAIIENFERVLNFEILLGRMKTEYSRIVKENLRLKPAMNPNTIITKAKNLNSFDEEAKESFSSFILLKYLSEHSESMNQRLRLELKESSKKTQRAFSFYEQYTGRIEVVMANGLIYPYLFPLDPISTTMTDSEKSALLGSIDRGTEFEKRTQFISAIPLAFDKILLKKKWYSRVDWRVFRILSTFCAFLINFFFIFLLEKELRPMGDDGEAVATNGLKDNGRYWMLYWYQIGYVQIGLSSLTLLLYLMSKWQMIFREHWRGRFVDLKPLARAQRSKFQSQLKLIGLEADERAEELLNKDPRDLKVAEFKDILKLEENDPKRKLIHLRFELESIFCIIKDHYLLYSLFYLMVSIIGLYVFSLSYLLHLFDIALHSGVLRNVISAFTQNWAAFVQVGIFWSLVIYIFAFLIFKQGFSDYGFLLIDENQCTYLFNCALSNFLNIENDRTIQPTFNFHYSTMGLYLIRSWWNVWFTVINKYIIKNIVAAIIIGAFAVLRRHRDENEEDDRTRCFICGLDRSTLDQHGGFIEHISNEHKLWDYFNFLFIMTRKEPSSFTGTESYIVEKVNSQVSVSNEEQAILNRVGFNGRSFLAPTSKTQVCEFGRKRGDFQLRLQEAGKHGREARENQIIGQKGTPQKQVKG